MSALPRTNRVLHEAIEARVFPGAIVEVGSRLGALATIAGGRTAYGESAREVGADTIYDLASLTKVLATTALALEQVARGRLDLDEPVSRWIACWRGTDRASVTVRHLLAHASGLPAHRPYYRRLSGRDAFTSAICAEPIEYPPGSRSVYSDPGFMLLGFVLEAAGGAPLDVQFDAWRRRALAGEVPLRYRAPADWAPRIAPTELDPWRGHLLHGDVHDENAAALGGVAGHAGLFGTAAAVGAAARWWLTQIQRTPVAHDGTSEAASRLAERFVRRCDIPGSSRALGWDTMLTTSSCGTRMSHDAFGHTGFTGTSLWIDPAPPSGRLAVHGRYVVFLSNRVHPTRAGDAIQDVRRAIHDAVADDLDRRDEARI